MRNICSGGHGYRSSLSEAIGVLDQVDEHLQQHQTVTVQEPPLAVNRKPQSDTSLAPLFVEQLCQVVLQLADVHKLDLRCLVLEAGEKRDVRRKSDETVDVALHDVEVVSVARLFPQQFEIPPDGGQGCLELVGSVRDEIGLDARQRHGVGDVFEDDQRTPFAKCLLIQFVDTTGVVSTVVLCDDCLWLMLADAAIDGRKAAGECDEFCNIASHHWQRICPDKLVELCVGRENGAGAVENDNRLRDSVQDGRECRRLQTFALDEYLALPQQRIACSLRSSELSDVGAHCKACQALH